MSQPASSFDHPSGIFPTAEDDPPSHARYIALSGFCIAAAVAYFSRNILGAAAPQIEAELGFSHTEMGIVMGAFFYSYSAMQIPGGWLGDRFGTRRTLTVLALTWAILTASLGLTMGFVSLLVAYVLVGVAQGGLFPCTTISFSRWFPMSERAFTGGALTSFMSLGGAIATYTTGFLLGTWDLDWRWVCALFGVPAIIWAIWFFWWFRDQPDEHSSVNRSELSTIRRELPPSPPKKDGDPSEWAIWGHVLSQPVMWLICGQQFFRAGGYIIFATWFPTYFQEQWGVNTEESALLTGLVLLGVVPGGIAGGLVTDWLWRKTHSRRISRQAVAIVTTLLCAGLVSAVFVSTSLTAAMVFLVVAASFQAAAAPCSIAITMDVGESQVSKVYSTMNTSGNIGAAVFPVVVGYLMDATNNSWDRVPIIFGCIYLASAICWMALNPNKNVDRMATGSGGI